MATTKKAIVYDDNVQEHRPMINGAEVLEGDSIQLSVDGDNALRVGSDGGLYAVGGAAGIADLGVLISGEQPNALTKSGVDNRLRVVVPSAQTLVSGDNPNAVKLGTDNRLLVQDVPANMNTSADAGNLITPGTDGKFFARTPEADDFISHDAGNKIHTGAVDQRLYVAFEPAGNYVSTNLDNMLTLGTDDLLFVPEVSAATLISTDNNNDLETGADGGLYINLEEQLAIDGTDQIITISNVGIKGSVALSYNSGTDTLQLLGKGGQIISTVQIQSGPSAFDSASIVTDPPGQPAGTYLALTFTNESGSQTVYVNMSTFITIYTAGDASIDITNFQVKCRIDPNNTGLKLTVDGLSVDYSGALSADAGNDMTVGTDGKFLVKHPPLASYISTNAGNILVVGSDGKYFVPTGGVTVGDVVSGGGLAVDSNNKLYVDFINLITSDTGNILKRGSDGKLALMPADARSTAAGNLIKVVGNKLSATATDLISGNANNALQAGTDGGLFITQASVPTAGAATQTANGTNAGVVTLAAANNRSALNMPLVPKALGDHEAVMGGVAVGHVPVYNTSFNNAILIRNTNAPNAAPIWAGGQLLDRITTDINFNGVMSPRKVYLENASVKTNAPPIDVNGVIPGGILEVEALYGGSVTRQIYTVTASQGAMYQNLTYQRIYASGVWTAWERVDIYSAPVAVITDFNDITYATDLYISGGSAISNSPPILSSNGNTKAGYLEVKISRSGFVIQTYTFTGISDIFVGCVFQRILSGSTWSRWNRMDAYDAQAYVNANGSFSTASSNKNYGFSAVTRTAGGTYELTLTAPFASIADFNVDARLDNSIVDNGWFIGTGRAALNTVQVNIYNNGLVLSDAPFSAWVWHC